MRFELSKWDVTELVNILNDLFQKNKTVSMRSKLNRLAKKVVKYAKVEQFVNAEALEKFWKVYNYGTH